MRGIVPDDILDALKKKKLGLPGIDIEITDEKNPMQVHYISTSCISPCLNNPLYSRWESSK